MVTRDYPPKIGGIATHTEGLVKYLRKIGVRVNVFAGYTDFATVTVPLRYSLKDYDVVHVQSTPYGPFITKRPLLLTCHAPLTMEWTYYTSTGLLRVPAAYLFERITIWNATLITADSNATRDELTQKYGVEPSRIEVIPSGVDCERFSPRPHDDGGKARILLCSRLEPRKDIMKALKSLSQIDSSIFETMVVGEGSERRFLEEFARKHVPMVRFVGRVPDEELPSYYASSDIFLATSLSEGFGLSTLQAMASGCAVIASNIPTHRDFIDHMVNGAIYSTEDDLSRLLELLLRDSDLTFRLGRAGRERALRYSWDRVAEMTLKVYRRLSGGY